MKIIYIFIFMSPISDFNESFILKFSGNFTNTTRVLAAIYDTD